MSFGVQPFKSVTVIYTESEGVRIYPEVSNVADNVSKLNRGVLPPSVCTKIVPVVSPKHNTGVTIVVSTIKVGKLST